MWVIWLCSSALGQDIPDRFPDPNVIFGVGAGRPALLSVRAEGWLADEFSAEVGFGLPGLDVDELAADLTLRLRPDALCFGCGEQNLLTLGLGAAALGVADRDFATWRLLVGPDVTVTGVHWVNPELGLQATLRGGVGARLAGPGVAYEAVDWWSFGSLGLSF
ncbi:MAG: hypothetical protein AAGA48_38710 [Myxococcota bacterium]